MNEQERNDFADKIIKATKEDKIEWTLQVNSMGDGAYVAIIPNMAFFIEVGQNEEEWFRIKCTDTGFSKILYVDGDRCYILREAIHAYLSCVLIARAKQFDEYLDAPQPPDLLFSERDVWSF